MTWRAVNLATVYPVIINKLLKDYSGVLNSITLMPDNIETNFYGIHVRSITNNLAYEYYKSKYPNLKKCYFDKRYHGDAPNEYVNIFKEWLILDKDTLFIPDPRAWFYSTTGHVSRFSSPFIKIIHDNVPPMFEGKKSDFISMTKFIHEEQKKYNDEFPLIYETNIDIFNKAIV